MDKKLLKKDMYIDLVNNYLGELIEEVVTQYYEDKIDVDEEYIDILEFVTEKLMKNSSGSLNDFKKIIVKLSSKPSLARVIISYLVSKYFEERNGLSLEFE
ncbi:MAG: hypothetical protein QW716_04100 [Desulfurococcaceae archaeon]